METIAVMRGGSRDGETTTVAEDVRRVLAPSQAPGMVDVYEATGERVAVRGNEEEGEVFAYLGSQAAEGIPPEAQHMPES